MAEPQLIVTGNHYPCPICKEDPKFCPHSLAQMDKRVWENYIRKIVQNELRKHGKGDNCKG